MKRAVLLDVSAIMYRAFYANTHFRTKTEPTGAVYGFVNTLLRIIDDFKPDFIAAAFDVSRKSLKRTELYSEYKAQRESAPEDLIIQIPRIEALLDCFGIKRFKIEGHEADDVLGTLAKKIAHEDIEVIVVTGDKDLSQILEENIDIALLGKGDKGDSFRVLKSSEDVKEYLGVEPSKIPDLFGLIGDTSDGIPGVRKIGVKKAVPMLEKYGDLEGIYENIDKLTELPGIGKSLIQNLQEDRELAFLSRDLATIDTAIPEIETTSSQLVYKIDEKDLLELFKVLEFKSLIKKMKLGNNEGVGSSVGVTQGSLNFSGMTDSQEASENSLENSSAEKRERKSSERKNYGYLPTIIADDEEKFGKLCDELSSERKIICYPASVGIAFAGKSTNYYVPLKHSSLLNRNLELATLQKLFDVDYEVIGYNLKELYHLGLEIDPKNITLDLLLGNHMLTSSTKDEFELLATRYCNLNLESYKDRFKKIEPSALSTEEYGNYMGDFAGAAAHMWKEIYEELKERDLLKVENEIEIPLIEILASMEKIGIKIDKKYFERYSAELMERLEEIANKIYGFNHGNVINLNSPKQLSQFLFLELSLPIIKSTKTGPSTDVEVLEALSEKGYEVADLILENRKLSKLLQTYSEPLPKLADGNGRVHTTFNQIGTATGRLSSLNPNLQNIPAKSDEGLKIRRGFVADQGKKLIGIDYSQIELRVLAEMSEDDRLIRAYKDNLDLHTLTAEKIFRLPEGSEITREQRTVAKIINFSIIYGKTAFGLSKELKISTKEASDYIAAYFEQYPMVKEFEKKCINFAEEHGYVVTYFGRKREIEGINSKNRTIKSAADRMAVNSVIQGTAAEIIKKAMIDIYHEIESSQEIKLLLQVHDELIFEVEESSAEKWREKLELLMENAVEFDNVKFGVNGAIGDNWAEIK